MPTRITQGKLAWSQGPLLGKPRALPEKTLPSCSLSLFLFFKQDLGAETMGLMLFFFLASSFSSFGNCGARFPPQLPSGLRRRLGQTRQEGGPGSVGLRE